MPLIEVSVLFFFLSLKENQTILLRIILAADKKKTICNPESFKNFGDMNKGF